MRLTGCTLAIIACLASPSYAEPQGAAYVEVAGNAFIYSINGELAVAPNRMIRVGGMLLPGAAIYARPGGLFFQMAATPFFTKHGAHGWSGISIGKTF